MALTAAKFGLAKAEKPFGATVAELKAELKGPKAAIAAAEAAAEAAARGLAASALR